MQVFRYLVTLKSKKQSKMQSIMHIAVAHFDLQVIQTKFLGCLVAAQFCLASFPSTGPCLPWPITAPNVNADHTRVSCTRLVVCWL